MIRQVTADGRVVSEYFVLYGGSSRPDRVEKVRDVVRDVAVPGRSGINFTLGLDGVAQRSRKRMLFAELPQVFVAQLFGPPVNGVAVRLWPGVLAVGVGPKQVICFQKETAKKTSKMALQLDFCPCFSI